MPTYNFTRLKRLIIIYWVVQAFILALLLFMAYSFQKLFAFMGTPGLFTRSVISGIAFQLVMIYPSWMLAKHDADIEVASCQSGLPGDQLIAFRRKRIMSDILKLSVIGFFVAFLWMAPDINKMRTASSILAPIYMGFLMILLTYFQFFNYLAKRKQGDPN